MKVIKRNGNIVKFQPMKIFNVIKTAMNDTKIGFDGLKCGQISVEIQTKINELNKDQITVNEIQDIVEEILMKHRPDVAKQYILYRKNRDEIRNKKQKFVLLDDEFISKYKHDVNPIKTELGKLVYYRTYSRYLPDEKRREFWWETVRRAIEYNCSLAQTSKEEAQELFDNVYNLRQFPSGRTLWVGGTPVAYKYPMSNFNCFSIDTEFLTKNGIKSFENFKDGDKTMILSYTGGWKEAIIKNFGQAEIVELTMNRGNSNKIIKTTANHLWYIKRSKNDSHFDLKMTSNLKIGDIFRTKKTYEHTNIVPCTIGIQHGIVFGDGTFNKKMNHCRVHLVGEKQELLKYFTTGSISTTGKSNQTVVYGLPNNWKNLPDITMNVEYLMGFLMGLFATDGSVSNSTFTISNKDQNILKSIKSMLQLVGINSSDVILNRKYSPFDNSYSPLYKLNIQKYDLKKDFFILNKHNERFGNENPKNYNWKVKDIKYTGKYEDVWCIQEPERESFTLSNGVLTHNCSGLIIDNLDAKKEDFYLLMLGSGVGTRILKEDVAKIPKIRNNYELIHEEYNYNKEKIDNTNIIFKSNETVKIIIGDSKEGWSQAIEIFFKLLCNHEYENIKTIILNYDYVRPKGEKLKTFGGTASGHESLKKMFYKIDKVIKNASNESKFKLRPIHSLDIVNIIAENVVSGGVRRSSGIALISPDDKECIEAKSQLYKQIDGKWQIDKNISHRQMSNNSIFYKEKPNREQLHWNFEQIRYSGEPAFINYETMKKRKHDAELVNPCGEVLLTNMQQCNLVTINVFAFVNENGELDYEGLYRAQYLSARAALRMTCTELELPKWSINQKRDRLTGCSLTGWQDMINATKMSKNEEIHLLNDLREIAHKASNEYSKQLGIENSALITTVKPEGTISQIPTVSSGVHYSHSPYFIRRVRITATDPLCKVCEELGYPVFPEVGQDPETCVTKYVEFPVKAPEGKTKFDVTAIEQLENYKMFMENYVDHNCSISISVRNHEWEEVEEWVWNNWDSIVGVSFISLDDNFYEAMPYEEITKEEYEERLSKMNPFVASLISKYEIEETELDLGNESCSSGVCPTR